MRGGTRRTKTAMRYPTYLYVTRAGFEIGRVSRKGRVLSSISSRISAVAFTRVTKMRTTWRNKGIMRIWNKEMSKIATRAAANESVRMRGKAGRQAGGVTWRVARR